MTALAAYVEELRRFYGDLSRPRRDHALDAAKRRPFKLTFDSLSSLGAVMDDTEINSDVCFTFVVELDSVLIVKLSMVGPYAVVLSFGPDGLGNRGRLLVPGEDTAADRIFQC